MEVEKRGSKGGFLSFFDWGGKSKKKLFPNNNGVELDGIKKVKESVDEHVLRFRLVEYGENRGNTNNKGNGEFNCASSMSSDDGHRTGAPSVVARLMGLDTMPNVNVNGPCSAQNVDSYSLRNEFAPGNSLNSRFEGFYTKDHNYSYDQYDLSRVQTVMTPQKMPCRPIERFQTEALPPRSAKTIPISHHKLLSPIKSSGFIPTKNAAYIMEAASRMIHPERTAVNGRMASHASSSVPIRIRDLKERMEASQNNLHLQKPKEYAVRSNANHKEANPLNGSLEAPRMKVPLNSVRGDPDCSRSRVKLGPNTEVGKSEIPRREGHVSSNTKNSTSHSVVYEAASKQLVKKCQQGIQRSEQRKAAIARTPSALRLNNQKQNDTQSGNNQASNSSVPNQLKKKTVSVNASLRINNTAQKSGTEIPSRSRKDTTSTVNGKIYSVPKGMKARQPSKPKNGINRSTDLMSETVLVSKDGKSIQCNAVIDSSNGWTSGNNKDGMDVISFTFSSPIKKHAPNIEDSARGMVSSQQTGEYSHNSQNAKMSSLSPQRFNGFGPDALGILLEQKLKELTCRIDSSSGTYNKSHETRFQDSVQSSNLAKASSEEYKNSSQFGIASENSDSVLEQEGNSYDLFPREIRRAWEIEDCYSVSKKSSSKKKLDAGLKLVSYAEDSPLNEGWCSSSENSCSVQDVNMMESCNQAECEVDSLEALDRKRAASYSCLFSPPTISWELNYVRDVVGQTLLRLKHYLLDHVDSVINPKLFDELENRPSLSESESFFEDSNTLERKLLFDCISELTNHRCQQLTTGCSINWSKWATWSHQTESFAQELHKEISSLKNMDELMVDEVVDKDMSTGLGRWVHFDVEVTEECIEMVGLILSTLVDEVVADFLI